MLLVRHLYTSIHHEVKGILKGTPSIHPPLTSLGQGRVAISILSESSYDWCELSYEFEACCLRASLMWGKLSLGRDVCYSPQHGLHVNSLLGLVY